MLNQQGSLGGTFPALYESWGIVNWNSGEIALNKMFCDQTKDNNMLKRQICYTIVFPVFEKDWNKMEIKPTVIPSSQEHYL